MELFIGTNKIFLNGRRRLTLVNNLTDNVGAISSLCFPLSAHEAKLRDWKQLCQGEDAGDLLDKISVF